MLQPPVRKMKFSTWQSTLGFKQCRLRRRIRPQSSQFERYIYLVFIFIYLIFSSPELTGELIVYPCSGVRPSSVRPSFTISKIFSSETAWPIKAKLHVEHPYEGGTKVYINGPAHVTKMAAMAITMIAKTYKNLFLQNQWADFHETWYVALGTWAHHSLHKS